MHLQYNFVLDGSNEQEICLYLLYQNFNICAQYMYVQNLAI